MPAASASAAPTAPSGGQPFTSPDVGKLAQPYRDAFNNAADGYQDRANAVYDGYQNGANAVFDGYEKVAQEALDRWAAAGNDAVAGWQDLQDRAGALQAPAGLGLPAAMYPAPIWHPPGG